MSSALPPDELQPAAIDDSGLDIDVLRRRREKVLTLLAIVAILAASAIAAHYALKPAPVDVRVIASAAQQAVREAVGLQFVFEFGKPVHADQQADGQYLVRGEAVAVTTSGAASHYWYDCYVRQNPDGTWAPAQLTLLPQ